MEECSEEMSEACLKADDFIVKPFTNSEFIIRLNRIAAQIIEGDAAGLLRSGNLVLDSNSYEVAVGGRFVDLAYREYELLKFLMENRGIVFSRDSLLQKVWGYDYFGGDRTVDVHIRRLRQKIEDAEHMYIETIRSVGYRFIKNVP